MFWNHIEPEQEKYNFKETDILMTLNKNNNMQVTLYFSIINGRTIGPYPDWMGTPGFGTSLERKSATTIDTVVSRYDGVIDSVIIGAELDSYFDDAEGSVDLYKESFQNIYHTIKQKHPDLKIGNAFSLNNVLNKNLTGYVTEFAETGDFVAFTYLPVDRINDITKTPAQAQADLQKALDLVPNNKVAFFEVGWSTAQNIGGSESGQEEFIKLAYDFYRQNESKIEFFNWYRTYDRPDGSCVIDQKFDEESRVSLTNNDEFVRQRLGDYVCNAGLLKTDDSAKPGWTELKKQIQSS
jgi:GH35 family endo-1,4-beta-xylanase